MTQRNHRLGRVMRLWVYVCAIILIMLLCISFWVGLQVSITHTRADQDWNYRRLSVCAVDARLGVEYWPDVCPSFGSPREAGYATYLATRKDVFPPVYGSGWVLPASGGGGSSVGVYQSWNLPIAYPCVLFVMISAWLIRVNQVNRGTGYCTSCGYLLEGLANNTCPECGATITHG
jgi:hypothetical protein